MNITATIAAVADEFARADLAYGQGCMDARDEAAWLVTHAMQLDTPVGYAKQHRWAKMDIPAAVAATIAERVRQRITTRQPLAYLLNECQFAGHRFYIDPNALIPRSYVGEWVTRAFAPWITSESVAQILDLGTGSGCIAISCAYAFPHARVTAADISSAALTVAAQNIARHQLTDRVALHHGDGFAGLTARYDLLICNPPYVSQARMCTLPREVRYEPAGALDGGVDGLRFIVPLLRAARRYLTPHGLLVVEVGSAAAALERRFPTIPFTWLATATDEKVLFCMAYTELLTYDKQFFDDHLATPLT